MICFSESDYVYLKDFDKNSENYQKNLILNKCSDKFKMEPRIFLKKIFTVSSDIFFYEMLYPWIALKMHIFKVIEG